MPEACPADLLRDLVHEVLEVSQKGNRHCLADRKASLRHSTIDFRLDLRSPAARLRRETLHFPSEEAESLLTV